MSTTKKCKACKEDKNLDEFTNLNKIYVNCKECRYRLNQTSRRYKQRNPERIKQRSRDFYKNNKDKELKRHKEYREKNRDLITERARKRYDKNKRHQCYENNKELHKQTGKKWREDNIEHFRKYQREWIKNKRKTDPHYTIQSRLRNRLLMAFKRGKGRKSVHFTELIGCSFKQLEKHIESQFTENMNWDAFFKGEIVIDHIKPCCAFNLKNTEEQKQCFHYSNLRPLWKEDNQRKISEDLKQRKIR